MFKTYATKVLVSIGYRGVPLKGLEQYYDAKRGVIKNMGGKVDGGLYVSGWLKRGPSGIIGTNIMDAKDTVVTIVKDLQQEISNNNENASDELLEILKQRNVPIVTWADFAQIDANETNPKRKRSEKQPREKLTNIKAMLQAAQVV